MPEFIFFSPMATIKELPSGSSAKTPERPIPPVLSRKAKTFFKRFRELRKARRLAQAQERLDYYITAYYIDGLVLMKKNICFDGCPCFYFCFDVLFCFVLQDERVG
jgi:hypothetical protein